MITTALLAAAFFLAFNWFFKEDDTDELHRKLAGLHKRYDDFH